MEDSNNSSSQQQQQEHRQMDLSPEIGSQLFDDGGRNKRSDTVGSASGNIIAAVIGLVGLSLACVMGRLGWIVGPVAMLIFPFLTHYTACTLLTHGNRNYSYMDDAALANLGGMQLMQVTIGGWRQYLNLLGVAICYTIAASISMMSVVKSSNCFHEIRGEENPCDAISTKSYMIIFGVAQIILSHIPGFDLKSWLSIVGVVMSFIYSAIGLGLGIAKVAVSLSGIPIGASVTTNEKIWRIFHGLGDIAFAYSYSMILIEIQDTRKSPPSEASSTMKRASAISVGATTVVYILHGVIGYAAFGDSAPKNLLSGFFEFSNPFWILKIANAAIVVHLIIAYQVNCKPLFVFAEKVVAHRFRGRILNILFRLVWRTAFVITTTVIPILLPFDDMGGLLVALSLWALIVHYLVEMYIKQKRIPKWSIEWWALQILRFACLVITVAASASYVAGFIYHLKGYKPFATTF